MRVAYRRALLRIAADDLYSHEPTQLFPAVASALSDLAGAALEAGLAIARAAEPDHVKTRLAIIGMGKCGAQELNYVSDVDVVFVAEPREGVPEAKGLQAAARLAGRMMRVCSDTTVEGSDGNSGFYLRDQWELQIYGRQQTNEPHSDGSLYSLRAPSVHASHGANRWNHMFVKVIGQEISVWQNGRRIHHRIVLPTRTDDHGRPTREFSRAPFKLQGDHAKVWFTNLWIRPLPDDAE